MNPQGSCCLIGTSSSVPADSRYQYERTHDRRPYIYGAIEMRRLPTERLSDGDQTRSEASSVAASPSRSTRIL